MSKYVASESKDEYEAHKTGGKRGEGDKENEDEEGTLEIPSAESLLISTVVSTVPATTDQFMHTPDFRKLFVGSVHTDTLMALRVVTKAYNELADALIDEGMESGEIIVHHGKDISEHAAVAREERYGLVMRVLFLLNIMNIGTCTPAITRSISS